MESCETATMHAVVIRVCPCRLIVCDCETKQEVLVRTDRARCFRRCDHVCIEFSGAMTMSIPPQISACRIRKTGCPC